MSQTLRYCHGCNEKFAVHEDGDSCPRCSQRLSPLATAPTAEVFLTANVQHDSLVEAGIEHDHEADQELVGQEIGQYKIERFLGRGGMARVYQAMHQMLERKCAIKVLDPKLAERDPEYEKMFLDEARAAAALVHPHVVTVHNIGEVDKRRFIEMEHVDGDSLQRLVQTSGRMPVVRATEVMVQACSGLAEAHRQGIIHRDLKPANILLTSDGDAKLADFGLAKRVHAPENGLLGGGMVGTPYYMAPELFHRVGARPQSDVYAAGVTFYYLLTGELPYVDTSLSNLAKKKATGDLPEDRPEAADLSEEVGVVLKRCLAKDVAERYADAIELTSGLEALYGNLRSLASLLREALGGAGVRWSGSGNHFEVVVHLETGRSQRVRVEATQSGRLVDRLVRIYSVCAPLNPSFFRRALELNSVVPHGSIALENVDGVPHFVMVNAYPRGSCDAVSIRRSVLDIARWADHVEKTLTGRDEN